eukprot:Opistho-2@3223
MYFFVSLLCLLCAMAMPLLLALFVSLCLCLSRSLSVSRSLSLCSLSVSLRAMGTLYLLYRVHPTLCSPSCTHTHARAHTPLVYVLPAPRTFTVGWGCPP